MGGCRPPVQEAHDVHNVADPYGLTGKPPGVNARGRHGAPARVLWLAVWSLIGQGASRRIAASHPP